MLSRTMLTQVRILRPAVKHLNQCSRCCATKTKGRRGFAGAIYNYFSSLKWVPIPLGVGFAYVSYQQFGHVVKREEMKLASSTDPEDMIVNDWVVTLYKCLPLKIMSRLWGRMNNVDLPTWMRRPVYKLYIWAFNCNLEEAAVRDLTFYNNLGEFFRRRLRQGVRPVDPDHCLTSPCDGRILYFGKAERGVLEQVKGITYSLQDFMGPQTWPGGQQRTAALSSSQHPADPQQSSKLRLPLMVYQNKLAEEENRDIYHCVIYLAPGDYHGFHSPTNWTVSYRRHFPGELFSVNPGIARLVRNLFNLNERAVYMGRWDHGFFSMTAVGATNVGSIRIYHDKTLLTNLAGKYPAGVFHDECFARQDLPGLPMKKGDSFGEFNLGSTIVLVFEAPRQFEFKLEPGQRVRLGEPIGCLKNIPVAGSSGA